MNFGIRKDGGASNCESNTTTRTMRMKLSKDDDIRSPVLGLRILPRTSHDEEKQPESPSLQAFTCKLCQSSFADPVKLASHPCSRIQNVRYDCPECGKSFNCPANLASHRRWHKPKDKPVGEMKINSKPTSLNDRENIESPSKKGFATLKAAVIRAKSCKGSHHTCDDCGKMFRQKSCLLQHAAAKHANNSTVEKCEKLVSRRTPPPSYESHAGKLKDSTITTTENRFEGLAALAYAAEVHSRMIVKLSYANETLMKKDSRKRAAENWNDVASTKCFNKSFDQPLNSNIWLPPSPPRSDTAASPLSVASDDARSPISNELDAGASPPSYQTNTSRPTAYPSNAYIGLPPANKNLIPAESAAIIGMKQGVHFTESRFILRNSATQNFGWRLLKQRPIWNPMYM